MADPRYARRSVRSSLFRSSRSSTLLVAVAVFGLGACGLSLVVDGISPDPVDASIVVPGDDTGTPPPDGDAPVMPDGALDPDTSDANVRETAPPPNRDGGTLLDALRQFEHRVLALVRVVTRLNRRRRRSQHHYRAALMRARFSSVRP